jgi:hypothetical protein
MNGTESSSQPPTKTRSALDVGHARRCLATAARRNADMVALLDLDQPVKGSEWTVGATATHLIVALRGFTHSASGEYEEWFAWEERIPTGPAAQRLKVLNRAMIAAEPRQGPAATARAITDGVDAFLSATSSLPPDRSVQTPWYGAGNTLTVAQATCLLLGEQVLHGHDIANSAGRKYPITREEARLIFEAVQQMLPKMADPTTIGDVSATYELRLGGSSRFVVRVADGAATVEPATGQRVDCHVLAEPVALLLLGYGRINQWQAIGRFKMITWGTKPWLAFRFTSFFSNP